MTFQKPSGWLYIRVCECLGLSHNAGSQAALSYTSKQKNARHGRATRSRASFSGLSPLLGLVLCQGPRAPTPLCPGELLGLWIKAGNKNPESFTFDLVFPTAKRPVSPYSGYNGQLLTSVYQPTEMALMHKGPVSRSLGFP